MRAAVALSVPLWLLLALAAGIFSLRVVVWTVAIGAIAYAGWAVLTFDSRLEEGR